MATDIKGPGIFLAQFAGDAAPFNSFAGSTIGSDGMVATRGANGNAAGGGAAGGGEVVCADGCAPATDNVSAATNAPVKAVKNSVFFMSQHSPSGKLDISAGKSLLSYYNATTRQKTGVISPTGRMPDRFFT